MAAAVESMKTLLNRSKTASRLRLVSDQHDGRFEVRVRDRFALISDGNDVTSIDDKCCAEMLERFPTFQLVGPTVKSLSEAREIAHKFIKRYGPKVLRLYQEEICGSDRHQYTLAQFAKREDELVIHNCEKFWI